MTPATPIPSVNRFSDEFVIEQAKGCSTYAKLHRKLGWSNFLQVVAAADRLSLGLTYSKTTGAKPLPPRDRACPKPAGKSGKKPKGGGDE